MSGYVKKNLITGEEVIYEAKLSLWHLAPQIILGFILLFALGLGLLVWLAVYLKYSSTELAITNKRVIAKFGFIRRNTVELNLKKLESIRVEQGILGRIFNFGSIIVAGAGNPQAPIPGISDPLKFRQVVLAEQENVAA